LPFIRRKEAVGDPGRFFLSGEVSSGPMPEMRRTAGSVPNFRLAPSVPSGSFRKPPEPYHIRNFFSKIFHFPVDMLRRKVYSLHQKAGRSRNKIIIGLSFELIVFVFARDINPAFFFIDGTSLTKLIFISAGGEYA